MFESSSILIPGAGKKCPECKAPSHVLLVRASDGIGPFTNGLLDRDCKSVSKAPRPEITKVPFLPHGTFDPVRRSYWPFWPEGREHLVGTRWRGAIMSIATEMLSRRRDQLSSVERLIAALGWERATHEHILLRRYAVKTGSGDGLAECKQLLLPTHQANRRRFVDPVVSCNFCVKPVAPAQRSCIQRRVSAV